MKQFFLLLALLSGVSAIIEAAFFLSQNNFLVLFSVLVTGLSGYGWLLLAQMSDENEWLYKEMVRMLQEKD